MLENRIEEAIKNLKRVYDQLLLEPTDTEFLSAVKRTLKALEEIKMGMIPEDELDEEMERLSESGLQDLDDDLDDEEEFDDDDFEDFEEDDEEYEDDWDDEEDDDEDFEDDE